MPQLADDFLSPPDPVDGFLFVAREMLSGAVTIRSATDQQAMAVTHLCGHATETALKAALCKRGIALDKLRSAALGHDIDELWALAVENHVPLGPAPDWATQLSRVHGRPYAVRYPLGFHGIVLPAQAAMLEGCADLLRLVEAIRDDA